MRTERATGAAAWWLGSGSGALGGSRGLTTGLLRPTESLAGLGDPDAAHLAGVLVEPPDRGGVLEENQLAFHVPSVPRGYDKNAGEDRGHSRENGVE